MNLLEFTLIQLNLLEFAILKKKCISDGRTDGPTDVPMDGPTDGQTDGRTKPYSLLIEMRGRI